MRRIVVVDNLTLDGVMQAPGRADEDTRGGFTRGGWAVPYADEVMSRVMGRHMADSGPLLLGRRTYDDFHGFWPDQPADNPIVQVLNNTRKYVVSRTRADLPWQNSTLIDGDVPERVAKLKTEPGGDIVVLGSGELHETLMRHDLVDEYVLSIHPLVLGQGRRLFPDGAPVAALQLVDSVTTTTGVILATYRRSGR
ncbi:MAG: dihydrofolate reductase [Actinophytocola sp.]|uniref:dihydrofolate reductase family protein n=1 Tax=Actinophytocola sp. TaxID=1872138 RepID=UPI0013226971|nr:dihydrofolate reductase family protein [Actinophytocola sp.]MPZ86056.1 dihydrofolate reductase [Actinophytocola sp.]